MIEQNTTPDNIKLTDSYRSGSAPLFSYLTATNTPQTSGYPAIVRELTLSQWEQPKVSANCPVLIPGTNKDQCEESKNVIGAVRCNDCRTIEVKVEHCESWNCPVCGSRKVRRQAKNTVLRLRGFKEAVGTTANPRHIVISSNRWNGMTLEQITKNVNNLFSRYLRELSGVYVIHMFRIRGWDDIAAAGGWGVGNARYHSQDNIKRRLREYRDQAKKDPDKKCPNDFWALIKQDVLGLGSWREYVYVSPHIHILGWGYLPNSSEFYQETGGVNGGFIYKTKEKEGRSFDFYQSEKSFDFTSEALKTLNYLGGHAAIKPLDNKRRANRIFRPFGYCSVFKLKETTDQDYQKDKDVVRVSERIIMDKKCPTCKSLNCVETRIKDIHNYYKAYGFDEDFNPLDSEGKIFDQLITPIHKFQWDWIEYHFAGYDIREKALAFGRTLPQRSGIHRPMGLSDDLPSSMGSLERAIMLKMKYYDQWKFYNQNESLKIKK